VQLTSKRTLYRSTDGGKTWANQMDSIRRLHSGHHRFRCVHTSLVPAHCAQRAQWPLV